MQVPYLSGVSAIAAGSVHSLALKSDGKVGVWGDNQFGQLDDGSTSDRHAPILLNTVGNVKAIAAGGSHSLAMVSDPVLAQ